MPPIIATSAHTVLRSNQIFPALSRWVSSVTSPKGQDNLKLPKVDVQRKMISSTSGAEILVL